MENSDMTFTLDNEALFSIAKLVRGSGVIKFKDLNHLVSLVMSGITSSMRFPGELNSDLRGIAMNLIPFPRLHFLTCSQAPLYTEDNAKYIKITVDELVDQMFDSRYRMSYPIPWSSDDRKMKDLAVACIFRGNTIDIRDIINGYARRVFEGGGKEEMEDMIPTDIVNLCYNYYKYADDDKFDIKLTSWDIESALNVLHDKKKDDFVEWIPDNIKIGIVGVTQGTEMSGTMIANKLGIKRLFDRQLLQFGKMYFRKAFLHWYKGEGMDQSEFDIAEKNVRDLSHEYQDKQDAVVELYESDEYVNDEDSDDSENEQQGPRQNDKGNE